MLIMARISAHKTKDFRRFLPALIACVAIVALAGFAIWERQHRSTGSSSGSFRTVVDRGLTPEMKTQFEERLVTQLGEIKKIENEGKRDISQYLVLGNLYYSLGRLGEAADAYRNILSTNPNDSPALQNLGQALLEEGDKAGAEDNWRKALLVEPEESYFLRLANLMAEQAPARSVEDERILLESAVATLGQTPGLLYRLGEWYERQGRYEEAISHYKVSLQLGGEDASLAQTIKDLEDKQRQVQLKTQVTP